MLNYKGLEAVYEHMTVGDEQIDRQIDRLIEQNQASVVVSDRPSQLGDEIVLDFTGFCDGTAFEGGKAAKIVAAAYESSASGNPVHTERS